MWLVGIQPALLTLMIRNIPVTPEQPSDKTVCIQVQARSPPGPVWQATASLDEGGRYKNVHARAHSDSNVGIKASRGVRGCPYNCSPMTHLRVSCVLMLFVLVHSRPALAQHPGHDTHLWVQAVAVVAVGEDWLIHLEEQPRWFSDVSEPFQVLTRTAVGRRVNRRLTLWAGHAWIAKPPGPGVAHEQRAWQQVSITLPAMYQWATSLRVRQEQRWQAGWADSSHRIRLMGRAVRPIGTTRWSMVAWDEVMVNLDGAGKGPPRGFDQNRLFGGVVRRLPAGATLDAGYLWMHQRLPSGARADAHVPFTALNLSF